MSLEQTTQPLQQAATTTPKIGSLIALFGASGIALLGNSVSAVALPWFVLATGGSAAETGLAAFMGALPLVLGALLGGTVVDRLGYRRAGVLSDMLSFVSVALIPLIYASLGLPFWQLLVLVFLGALLDAPGATARQAMLPKVAHGAGMPLERANAIFESIEGLTMLAGPLVAGLLIAALGPLNAMWFNAATFLVSAALTASVRLPHDRASARPARSYREEFVEGLRFIWHDRLIRTVIMLSAAFMALIAPLFSVILPFYVEQTRGNAFDLGLILSAEGGGAIIGALSYAAWGQRLPKRGLLIGSLLAMGLGYAAMAALPPWPLMLLVSFLQGISTGPINPLINTVLQRRTPEDMRGRVLGLLTGLSLCAAPAGLLGAGLLLDAVGLQASLVTVAACVLAIGLSTPFLSALRELDQGKS